MYNASDYTVEGTKTAQVHVYAVNYNVLRIMSGMGGVGLQQLNVFHCIYLLFVLCLLNWLHVLFIGLSRIILKFL